MCFTWFDGKYVIKHGSEGIVGGAFLLDSDLSHPET
jgi:hypothetical protein